MIIIAMEYEHHRHLPCICVRFGGDLLYYISLLWYDRKLTDPFGRWLRWVDYSMTTVILEGEHLGFCLDYLH